MNIDKRIPNRGKTPPGVTVKTYTLDTENDYVRIFNIVDNAGMNIELALANLSAENDCTFRLTTKRIFGNDEVAETDLDANQKLISATATTFVQHLQLEVKSKEPNSPCSMEIHIWAIHTGNVDLWDIGSAFDV